MFETKRNLAKQLRRYSVGVAGILPLLAVFTDVHAQEPASHRADALDEVTVTARRREEPLQETPVAVTAFDDVAIQRYVAKDMTDIGAAIPNVIFDNFLSSSSFTLATAIRGISTQENDNTLSPSTLTFQDGVVRPLTSGGLVDFFDVETVEVLRGPQGTLFGKNALGGAIIINSRKPTGELGVRAEITAGDFDLLRISAAFDFPISDTLAGKVSIFTEDRSGFYKVMDESTHANGTGLRKAKLHLVYEPSDAFDASLIASITRNRSDGSGVKDFSQPGQIAHGLWAPDPFEDPYVLNASYLATSGDPGRNDYDDTFIDLQFNWDFGAFSLNSITGYIDEEECQCGSEAFWTADRQASLPAFLFLTPQINKSEMFSQELKLLSEDPLWGRVSYVAGLYYFDHTIDVFHPWFYDGLAFGLPVNVGDVTIPVDGVYIQDDVAWAAYAQTDTAITDRLSLTIGLRYTWEEKELVHTDWLGVNPFNTLKHDWSAVTPKLGLDYTINDDVFMYASFSQGFKSGGFNGRGTNLATLGPYNEETADSYELGMKGDFLDQQLRLNVAIFFNEYTDIQIPVTRPAAGGGFETIINNAGELDSKGAELEFTWLPFDGLRLGGSVGYLDAEYKQFFRDLCFCGENIDATFLKPLRSPEWTTHLTANYSWQAPKMKGEFDIGASHSYTSELETDPNNSVGRRDDASTLDAHFAFSTDDGRYRVSLWGKNLTDELIVAEGFQVSVISSFGIFAPPRTYGVQVSMSL